MAHLAFQVQAGASEDRSLAWEAGPVRRPYLVAVEELALQKPQATAGELVQRLPSLGVAVELGHQLHQAKAEGRGRQQLQASGEGQEHQLHLVTVVGWECRRFQATEEELARRAHLEAVVELGFQRCLEVEEEVGFQQLRAMGEAWAHQRLLEVRAEEAPQQCQASAGQLAKRLQQSQLRHRCL